MKVFSSLILKFEYLIKLYKCLLIGQNILVPKPAFPLYQVITQSLGGYVKHYPLKPDDRWECDLEKMNELVDANTRAIVINNPSNPCGSNFSIEHLYEIAKIARKHNLLIIADEIYGGCVFNGNFHPFHKFSGDVPVITLGGPIYDISIIYNSYE